MAGDDETLARPWVKPGTPGLTHRIGGIEKADGSGNISYDPENHQRMTDLRTAKIDGIAKDIPKQAVELGNEGRQARCGWLGVNVWAYQPCCCQYARRLA